MSVVSRHALAVALFTVSLACSSLASTAPAATAAITSAAFIEAEGCGDQQCDEDQKSDEGFNRFDRRVTAHFKAAHGKITAHSSQNTSLFAPTGELSRVVSRAAGDALYRQEPPDHRFSACGCGRLDVGFSVDSLVAYSVLGSMRVSGDPDSACSNVRLFLDPVAEAPIFEFVVRSPQGCGAPATMSFNQSGTLAPGFYSMGTNVRADGTSQVNPNGFASGSYEFRLLLDEFACTIQITQPGQTTQGTSGNDVICGSSGDDTVFGLEGNDTIYGEGGSDTIDGGSGRDGLLGADGADCLDGGADKDVLKGEAGDDKLLAKDGTRDEVKGGPSPDKGRFDPRDDVRSVSNPNFRGGC
ncbi:MAG: calcium-binding protein [Solirubrobacterales bacterium]